jgi:hypothetical protein
MKTLSIKIFIVITLLLLSSCRTKENKSEYIPYIKELYNYESFGFRLDTLKSFDNIEPFLDSIAISHREICHVCVAFYYNLAESSFTPSSDSTMNIKVACDYYENCPIMKIAGNDFIIDAIKNDSLTLTVSPLYSYKYFITRIPINNLRETFNRNLDTLFNPEEIFNDLDFIVRINTFGQTQKEDVLEIINEIFCEYNKRVIQSFKNGLVKDSINLDGFLDTLRKRKIPLWAFISPIHFDLTNDTLPDFNLL